MYIHIYIYIKKRINERYPFEPDSRLINIIHEQIIRTYVFVLLQIEKDQSNKCLFDRYSSSCGLFPTCSIASSEWQSSLALLITCTLLC